MKRSGGVTVAAIVALIGSVGLLLLGLLAVLAMLFAPAATLAQGPVSPEFMRTMALVSSLVYLLPAAWGITTSIGLFRLKNWARISTIVFAVLLVIMSVFSGLISALMPLPASANGGASPAMVMGIRAFMAVFWLSLLGIGVWWLVFFTRAGVKMQFAPGGSGALASGVTMTPSLAGAEQALPIVPAKMNRPLSITIIAWLMLAGCVFMPLGVLFHAPVILFKTMVRGWVAAVFYLGFGVIHFFVGRGLLRLRPWARQAAIGLYLYAFVNSAVFYLAPGGRARYLALLESQRSMFGWERSVPTYPAPFDVGALVPVFILLGLLAVLVPAYFLITRSAAFENRR